MAYFQTFESPLPSLPGVHVSWRGRTSVQDSSMNFTREVQDGEEACRDPVALCGGVIMDQPDANVSTLRLGAGRGCPWRRGM